MTEQGLPLGRTGKERDEHHRMVRPTAKLKPELDMKEGEPSQSHNLGPLTINTQSLESFGLGPNYTEVQPIGFGVHGLVVSALERTKQQRVAAKKIKVESQLSFKYALREVRIMCQMKHENIVRVMDVMLDDGAHQAAGAASENKGDTSQHVSQILQMYIVTELLDTNLHVLITQKLLESDHVTLITYQLVRGLHYLRSANVIHRDLKPSNLFINCDTLLLKIGDFGLARIVDPNYCHSGHLTADLGTYWYRAPELMLSPQSYTPAVDIWSVGCIVGEMLLGKPLFTGATDDDQLRHIVDTVELTEQDWSALLHVLPKQMLHQHPLTPQRPLSHRLNDVDPAVIDLLENMLVFDPHDRMTPIEALSHSYLKLYAKPDKEPVAADPFRIEAEVDDISTEHLKKMIHEERCSRQGKRGVRIPLPSPIDHPKISSATLSLKPTTDISPKQVPSSPTFDIIMQEQRHNRRNKMSASVDLSFISLSNNINKPEEQPSTSMEPEKVVYSTKGYPIKQATPPCPWKWPEIKPKESREEDQSSSGAESGGVAGASPQSEELIFKHIPSMPTKKVPSPLAKDQPSTPPGFSSVRGPNSQTSRQHKDEVQPRVRRMKPKKRGFVDVGGFDDEDFIHLGIPHDADTRRYSADPLSLGKIECYEEKDQARIDRELNRKNRTASMDLSYIRVPHVHYTPAMSKPSREVSTRTRISRDTPGSSRLDLSSPALKSQALISPALGPQAVSSPALSSQALSSQALGSPALGSQAVNSALLSSPAYSTSSASTNKVSEALLHPEPPVSATIMSSSLLGDGMKKRASDVGIRIIRSPKPQRRVTSTGFEYNPSPVTSTERPRSSADIESYSPFLPPERKISVTSIESTQVPSRPMSREDSRRSSTTSYINITPVQALSNATSHSASISPVQLRTHTNVDKNNGSSPQFGNGRRQRTQSTDMTSITNRNHHRLSLYEAGNGFSSTSTEDYVNRESDYPDDIPERPPSVVSTLTIPPLSPVPDMSYSPKRRVSHTTLFLDDVSVNKEISKIDSDIDRCTSTEPPRCSSRLSVDLSFINKELQKKEEEEKDSVDVSPRKLQEDWEIESQSSQKSEWTLSEILGVPEEEVNRNQQSHQPSLDNNGAAASLYRAAPEPGTPTESRSRKVCRTKIDLIPYCVLTPDLAQKPHALTRHEEGSNYRNVPNNDYKSATAKLEDLSLETESRKFITECFIGGARESSSRRLSTGKDLLRDQAISFKDRAREHLYLDFKHPHPQKMPHLLSETPSASALMKFSQYKSEEDLVSPRSHSPRDVVGARAAMSRDIPDLPGFKQSVKENLSSLNVSIPKDFPEKRRLIKAHSTESVCSEGESSQKSQETNVMERSLEDLIQFSPVGGTKAETQDWNPYDAYKDDQGSQGSAPECNHCLYQGDCRGPTCGGAAHGEVLPKKDLHLQQPYTPHKVGHDAGGHPPAMGYIPEEEHRLGGRSSMRSSHDELCHSKDLFNERQKLIGGFNGEHEVLPGDSTSQHVRRRVRPKSAKN